jgi:trypsin
MQSHQKIALFLSNMVAVASSSSLRGGNTRIIGGEEATPGEYSYMVSLSDNISHFCGGSLLSRDVILSAA